MAGAGYKLFNTGDVLTAAQVNTYLMEQTVMVFADAAARTTALTGVVSEGMISYLKDTNAVEVYNGSAWVASDDPNAIQNTIVDAKGDLITATASDVPARLAVGNNGETLVADSSASTGLRWQGNFAAGKNKIINGDFSINQRGFSSVSSGFGFDRWNFGNSGATGTYSLQTFTAGAAPVAGYEAKNFARVAVTTGNDFARLLQNIEDVRTFAGQTITISFWAKGTNPTTAGNLTATATQYFGTGGSPSATLRTVAGTFVLTANWTRYSLTVAIPSISGKTIGTDANSALEISFGQEASTSTDAWTLDIWGVQVEAGNTATAFQTATGTLAGELAACQRYYYRVTTTAANKPVSTGFVQTSTLYNAATTFPVTMRSIPTALEQSGTATDYRFSGAEGNIANSAVPTFNYASNVMAVTSFTVASGLTAGRACFGDLATTSGYLGWSAEL
jgi:hypothetical protein